MKSVQDISCPILGSCIRKFALKPITYQDWNLTVEPFVAYRKYMYALYIIIICILNFLNFPYASVVY